MFQKSIKMRSNVDTMFVHIALINDLGETETGETVHNAIS